MNGYLSGVLDLFKAVSPILLGLGLWFITRIFNRLDSFEQKIDEIINNVGDKEAKHHEITRSLGERIARIEGRLFGIRKDGDTS